MVKKNDAPTEIETITLTMSRPVAEAVQAACEWYLRLHMGQFWDVADDLCMAKFYSDAKHNEFKTKEQRDNAFTVSIHRRNDMQDGLDNLYRRYVLPAPISDLMEIPYRAEQVWLVIRHALAWHAIATAMRAAQFAKAIGTQLPKPLKWQREFYDATGVFPYGWYECPVCGYRTDWEPHACPICHTLLEP